MKKKEYTAEDIQVIEWHEAVRKRPAMYVGSIGIQGFVNILKGIFANFYSLMGSKVFEAEKLSFEIIGKQAGKFYFEKLKTKIPAKINEALCLTGGYFAVLNALSQNYEFTIFDKDKNELLKQIYHQGILQSGAVGEKEYLAESLKINFNLDETIWEDFEINPYFIANVIEKNAFLNKDKQFELKYSINVEKCRIIYHFENGLKDLISIKSMSGWRPSLFYTYINKGFGAFSVEIAFAFRETSVDEPFFKSFVNNHYTHEKGTHADALILGIIKALKKFVKKYYPKEKYVITTRTVLSFLIGGIHLKMKQPSFYGATKNRLNSIEVIKPISEFVSNLLFQKLENDKEKAKEVIRNFAAIHWKKDWLNDFLKEV